MTIAIIAIVWLALCGLVAPFVCICLQAASIADQRESEGCGEGEGDGAWVHGEFE